MVPVAIGSIMVTTGLLYTLMVPLRPRFFSETFVTENLASLDDPALISIRLTLLIFICLCLAAPVLAQVLRPRAVPVLLWATWLIAAGFYLAPALGSLFVGGSIKREAFLIPPLFFSLLLIERKDRQWFVRLGAGICLSVVYLSLFAAAVAPDYAQNLGYRYGVFGTRLYGIMFHPSQLSVYPVLFFGLDLLRRRPWSAARVANWLAASTVLVWTDSFGSWVGLAVAVSVTWVVSRRPSARRLGLVALGLLPVLVLTIWAVIPREVVRLELSDRFSTFATRFDVWSFAVSVWQSNPILGYGPHFLREESLLDFLALYGWIPAQAHNQFFQTLAQGGLLGVGLWILYLAALTRCLAFIGSPARDIPLYLFLFMLVKGLVSVPFYSAPLSAFFFYHFMLFGLLVLLVKQQAVEQPSAPQRLARSLRSPPLVFGG